jgi:hypothetical protein
MKTIDGIFLRGIRILVDLVADSLHKIARGFGSSKGADNGTSADHQCPNLTRYRDGVEVADIAGRRVSRRP